MLKEKTEELKKLIRAKLLVPVAVIVVIVLTDVLGVPLQAESLYSMVALAVSLVVEEGYVEIKKMIKEYKK